MTDRELKILVFDPSGILKIPAVVSDSQEDFIGKIRSAQYDSAVIVWEESGKLSLSSFLRVIGHRAPLLPLVLLDDHGSEIRALIDIVLPRKTAKSKLMNQIKELLQRRKILAECGLVGRSESLQAIADTINRVATTDISTLVVGGSGTGKELVAKSIHTHSTRSESPFVAINCNAIPETLIESQLFGYQKGAFTGAQKDTPGFIDQSAGGTLFLDEIGEIPLSVQAKLLRFLETGEYFPVGSVKSKIASCRVVTATNKDLQLLIQQGGFREDLYYRIAGVKIFIPPLRDRPEDIPILAFFFAEKIASAHDQPFAGFSNDAISAMLEYHWPGNVRELRNFVENAVLLSRGKAIRSTDIMPYFDEHIQFGRQLPALLNDRQIDSSKVLPQILLILQQNNELLSTIIEKLQSPPSIDEAEKEAIERTLMLAGGLRKKAAEILGISLRTLYRKMNKYGIE